MCAQVTRDLFAIAKFLVRSLANQSPSWLLQLDVTTRSLPSCLNDVTILNYEPIMKHRLTKVTTSQYDIYPEYEVEDEHKILEALIAAAERHFVELSMEIN